MSKNITHFLRTPQEDFVNLKQDKPKYKVFKAFKRKFRVGDTLCFEEYNPELAIYTGNFVDRLINSVRRYHYMDEDKGYVVLGFKL